MSGLPARLVARLRSLWRGLTERDVVEAEIREEFEHHIAARTADLVRREGLSPMDARRRAHREFGHVEAYREGVRSSRGLHVFDRIGFSWLDFKLGLRMIARYPGLSVVAGLAMAFAIWVGVGTFEFVNQVVHPDLPLPDGERIVGLRYWDRAASWSEDPTALDLATWQEELTAVQDLGGWRTVERNLTPPGSVAEPEQLALISPVAFEVAGVQPQLGRALTPDDARAGAPAVVVLGHDLWLRRFQGDRNVVGRTVVLGAVEATVVGVMPEGFAFPVIHQLWTTLSAASAPAGAPDRAPAIRVFGRLAPGATMAETRAQLEIVTTRLRAAWPERYEHLRAQALPHAESVFRFALDGWVRLGMYALNVAVGLLLLLIASNVAMLMFARAAARESEIVVRNALGAGRGRIVGQLFVEAVVLVAAAAVVAVLAAGAGMRWGLEILRLQTELPALPFWISPELSPPTVAYTVLLCLVAATCAGVLPALRMTGKGMERGLGRVSAHAGGSRFGRGWTILTVAQITLTVIFAATALGTIRALESVRNARVGVRADEYLAVELRMDAEDEAGREEGEVSPGADPARADLLARYRTTVDELEARLLKEPGVRAVTVAEHLPVMYHPHAIIELDEGGGAEPDPQWGGGYRVSSTHVAPDFFDAFDGPVVEGRGFGEADLREDAAVVVVNRAFVARVLGDRSAIGRRVRYPRRPRTEWDLDRDLEDPRWYEIVGVVPDLGRVREWKVDGADPKVSRIYHPLPPQGGYPLNLAAHVPERPMALAPRLRRIAADVDPALRLHDVRALDESVEADIRFYTFWSVLALLVAGFALMLSMAGTFSITSFLVSRRTREIGIRVALGAEPRQIVAHILGRPVQEVVAGVTIGCILVAGFFVGMADAGGGPGTAAWGVGEILLWMAGLGGVVTAICLLATLGPTRRALAVQPSEALSAEG